MDESQSDGPAMVTKVTNHMDTIAFHLIMRKQSRHHRYGWMEGMLGCINGCILRTYGLMIGRTDRRADSRRIGRMDRWVIDGWMNRWTDGLTGECIDGWMLECMVGM